MTDDDRVVTEAEAAAMLRISPLQVRFMGYRKEIVRVPPTRPARYLRESIERHLRLPEGYDAADAEPHGETQTEAPPPRRGDRGAPQGPLEGSSVGSGGALRRRIGPQATDVAVRRVPR